MSKLFVTYEIKIRKSEKDPDVYYTVLGSSVDRVWRHDQGEQWRSIAAERFGLYQFAFTPASGVPADLLEAVRYYYNADIQ